MAWNKCTLCLIYFLRGFNFDTWQKSRSSRPEVFCKKGVHRNFAKFTRKRQCQSLFFNKVADLIKKDTLTQVFSCKICEISKNTFSYWTPPVAASENRTAEKFHQEGVAYHYIRGQASDIQMIYELLDRNFQHYLW